MENQKNYFSELGQVKCTIESKNGLNYISWAEAWWEVKKIYPDSNYTIYENSEGFPFWASQFWIDCKVGVTINWLEHIVRLPVMDNNNKSMKEVEYKFATKYWEKTVAPATTFDINKTIQRAFTKAIAMHGIGLYVFRWEDLPEQTEIILPEFTREIFEKFKATEKYKDQFEAMTIIEKKYTLNDQMKNELKEYYTKKIDWGIKKIIGAESFPPF